ncbi:hypothetical protein QJS10_CPA09g00751 [Acorus calamus]|uniref:Uncharacterized protein n=1 Tax=Acorus calamus TaxID=4465 RepID=A0AAV9E8S5_ACOCL|nr:hypothetical protein QJS10_CPA09g00751 [Acorus calamus]
MQNGNYNDAEEYYRKSLSMESDPNKQCNLAICLLQAGKVTEAKSLLQEIRPSSMDISKTESFAKSFRRASRLLAEFESRSVSASARVGQGEEDQEIQRACTNYIDMTSRSMLDTEDLNRAPMRLCMFDFDPMQLKRQTVARDRKGYGTELSISMDGKEYALFADKDEKALVRENALSTSDDDAC